MKHYISWTWPNHQNYIGPFDDEAEAKYFISQWGPMSGTLIADSEIPEGTPGKSFIYPGSYIMLVIT